MKSLRMLGIGVAVIGAVAALGIMVSTTSAVGGLSDLAFTLGFYVWVLLPFVLLILLNSYAHRSGLSPAPRAAALLTTVVVVVSSVFIYWSSIFGSESSTSALVFLFIPLYAVVGGAVLFGLAWLLLKPFLRGSNV
jgi:glucan phosphoethanolaminetransferase (alkaline phosphatase superfamily)